MTTPDPNTATTQYDVSGMVGGNQREEQSPIAAISGNGDGDGGWMPMMWFGQVTPHTNTHRRR